MTFQLLLNGAEVLSQSGNPSITGVEYDSRRVRPGTVFVAMKGESSDGNRFIDQAIAAGAVAIVTDSATEIPRPAVPWAQVVHGRRALARLSANFYKRPAERIANTGITGTNGKSTTAFLIESILQAAGRKTALIGTIEYHVAGKILPAPHTTPESLELNRLLSEGLGQGVTEAVMEVSSHALEQQRVFGIPFDVAVFTNLTRDHLDYHGTMENYFRAKQVLFEGCGTDPPRAAVLNIDDEYGRQLLKLSKKRSSLVLSYGLASGDFHADSVDITPRGTRFQMITPTGNADMWSPLIGNVNATTYSPLLPPGMPGVVPPKQSLRESSTSRAFPAASSASIAASPSPWSWITRTLTMRSEILPRWLAILLLVQASKAKSSPFSDAVAIAIEPSVR